MIKQIKMKTNGTQWLSKPKYRKHSKLNQCTGFDLKTPTQKYRGGLGDSAFLFFKGTR